MILDLEHIGNIPVSTSVIASLFTNIETGNQKVCNFESEMLYTIESKKAK